MDQRLSRPARWRGAVNRASGSLRELKDLHREWATTLIELRKAFDELCKRRDSASKRLKGALVDLANIKSSYSTWTVPENFSDSRTQEKLWDVEQFNFNFNIEKLGEFDMEDAVKSISESDLEDTIEDTLYDLFNSPECELSDARECELPKGYGRD